MPVGSTSNLQQFSLNLRGEAETPPNPNLNLGEAGERKFCASWKADARNWTVSNRRRIIYAKS